MSVSQLPRQIKSAVIAALVLTAPAGPARAHASDQGLVLLLPTDIYIGAGAAAVALTVLLVAVLPERVSERLFASLPLLPRWRTALPLVSSGLAALILLWLLQAGLTGSRDPLSNPLPLSFWTLWWIGVVSVQGLIGDIWRWINPWTGPLALLRGLGLRPMLHLPAWLGHWPALLTFLGFCGFLMADPAPSDPARLARMVGGYWLATLFAAALFGPHWLLRGEGLSVLMRNYAHTALLGRRGTRLGLGLWGWQVLRRPAPPLALATFMIAMLASGSFDGLNETFWWLAQLGVNPLEFPGRSAVVWQNTAGLIAANVALVTIYALTIRLGLWLAGSNMGLVDAFCHFAPSILPIALGYHIAHYYLSFLVDGQYALAALNDPLSTGADLLGLGTIHVTTGFFNTPDSVRLIFLTQAGAVVAGHIIAVLLAHALALRAFGSTRKAALSQAPLALFMIAYTFFGLWLLASPRGV